MISLLIETFPGLKIGLERCCLLARTGLLCAGLCADKGLGGRRRGRAGGEECRCLLGVLAAQGMQRGWLGELLPVCHHLPPLSCVCALKVVEGGTRHW